MTYAQWKEARGRFAYETYCALADAELPDFEELSDTLRRAWIETALAVCARYDTVY